MHKSAPKNALKTKPRNSKKASRSRKPEALHHDGQHWLLTGPNSGVIHRDRLGLVPALEHAVAIIETLNSISPRQASLAELSTALEISRSHCHSILKTLTAFGWLRFDAVTKVYQLDMGILPSISSIFRSGTLDATRAALDKLVYRLEIPLVLSRPQPDYSYILIDKFNVSHVLEVAHPIGHRYPRDAVGQMRAYLAWQPEAVVEEWLDSWEPVAYTKHTRLTRKSVLEELSLTRERGYSRSDEEFAEGLLAFCLPIFNHEAKVEFIVSCMTVKESLVHREKDIAQEMIAAIARIHHQIGARVPLDFPRASLPASRKSGSAKTAS